MEDNKTKKSAHATAVAKYNEKTYKTFSINLKKDEYEYFNTLLANTKQSKSGFLRATLLYAEKNEDFRKYLETVLEKHYKDE